MKPIAVFVVLFLTAGSPLETSQEKNDEQSSATVQYHNGNWTGNVVCHFYSNTKCALSVHVQGRRIDMNTAKSNENVFLSCFDSDQSIALSIADFTYEDIQDYVCLSDITQEYIHNWLNAYPYMEVEGVETVAAPVRLTCNSFPGAPLYWILPGTAQDNNDVIITSNDNSFNSSTTAIFTLKDSDDSAEYKCCIKVKDSQPLESACASHTFYFNELKIRSTYSDYSSLMLMTCIFGGQTTPSSDPIMWQQCSSSSSCSTVSSSYYTNVANEATHTVNSTLQYYYRSDYPIYKCFYNASISHTFNVTLGDYAPKVRQSGKETYYSADGYAVPLGCTVDANPEPTITWTKQNILDFGNGSEIITNEGSYTITIQQISSTEWETTLVIYPYDVNIHNAIYTCTANNSLGQQSLQMNTHEGPVNLDLKLVSIVNSTDGTDAFKAVCTFKAFPYPLNYYVSVVMPEDIDINTTLAYDERLYHAIVTVDFTTNTDIFPAIIECNAFNPFDLANQQQYRIIVCVNKTQTTTEGPTTTTYDPYQTTTYNPYQTTTYNPYQTTTYNPYQTTTYNPYQTTTRNPYQTTTYNPYQTTTYNPYQTTYYPYLTTTYYPYVTTTYYPYQTTEDYEWCSH